MTVTNSGMDTTRTAVGTGHPAPSVEDIERIGAIASPVLRNLAITDAYARLSRVFAARTGPRANWCTFATWASRQAGRTIRGEDLGDTLRRRVGAPVRLWRPVEALWRWLLGKGLLDPGSRLGRIAREIHSPFDAFERASDAVARGNLKVFAEIGREFARYLATCPAEVPPQSPEMTAFLGRLRPGAPPEGQDRLRQAFSCYQRQTHEPAPDTRAGLMLLANLSIGLHEQSRLQPEIAEAVDAPLATAADLGHRVLEVLAPGSVRWPEAARRPAAAALGWIAARLRAAAVRLSREVITERLMVLTLPPDIVLSLGRNLEAAVPPVVAASTVAELAAFVREFDPCRPGEQTCGADDWCDLRQRMHYILHLFRAYQEDTSLFTPPFTDEQVRAFERGDIPTGGL
jgi:hypothetical protein